MTPSRRSASSARKLVLAGACLLLLIPAVWCGRTLKAFRPGSARTGFPDAEIVYNGAEAGLGFVNADGSDVTTFLFGLLNTDFVSSWQSPLITGDRKTVIVTSTAAPGYPGEIFAIQAGESAVDCGWYGIVRFAADGYHLLVDTGEAIQKYLPADCGTGNPPEKVYRGVSGALSPDEEHAAEVGEWRNEWGLQPKIVLRRLATGETSEIGAGDFPAWSRDGRWLAYTGRDGIYLLENAAGAEPRRLVSLARGNPDSNPVYQEARAAQYYPPIASWSPDGAWLVYHVYSSSPLDPHAGDWAQYYSIFKVDVKTGETTKLLDGGYSPSWRWPVEEP